MLIPFNSKICTKQSWFGLVALPIRSKRPETNPLQT
jgi:hypothetical protein